jgi:hypothetical protein
VTNQPYYYNPTTHEKTWARPKPGQQPADTVTATPVVPMQQPRSLQPGRRRNGSAPGHALGAAQAASCASAPRDGEREREREKAGAGGNGGGGGGGAALSDTL